MQGRGWEEGGVIVGPEYSTSIADPFRVSTATPLAPAGKAGQQATAAAVLSTAADPSQDLHLTVRMPKAVSPGNSVSVTCEVVSLKGKGGGSPVEFTLDAIPASVSAAGMSHCICPLTST